MKVPQPPDLSVLQQAWDEGPATDTMRVHMGHHWAIIVLKVAGTESRWTLSPVQPSCYSQHSNYTKNEDLGFQSTVLLRSSRPQMLSRKALEHEVFVLVDVQGYGPTKVLIMVSMPFRMTGSSRADRKH